MLFILNFAKVILKVIYAFVKIFPTRHRICFFSRQSDDLPTDFKLIIDSIVDTDNDIEIKVICNRFRYLSDGPAHFIFNQVRSMYYLATSKVCILDAYWPAVSMLKHKKILKVIQLWHSIGKIKQSGYQTVDRAGGRNSDVARIMCMHQNYDYLIAGGEAWNKYYCEAFKIEEEKIRNYGLPRLDLLIKNRQKESFILERHPELQGKIVVLYAPTYRKYEINPIIKLQNEFNDPRYALIWKMHPNQKIYGDMQYDTPGYEQENIFELMQLCDYFLTDYSSLALEAAVLNKKTFFYLFDYDRYNREYGLNIDLYSIVPNCVFENEKQLFDAIDSKLYPNKEMTEFRNNFLPKDLGISTERIKNLILECLK